MALNPTTIHSDLTTGITPASASMTLNEKSELNPETGDKTLEILAYGKESKQTTYYSCVAFVRETHCGWHASILDTSSATKLSSHRVDRRKIGGVTVACMITGLMLVM
ncbi:hypothetical protein GGS21DRAFT_494703 [Xylaria nigripes]|nr:hypothetical protein GGS21DRAFT_494703 [Xylaria nigripes]